MILVLVDISDAKYKNAFSKAIYFSNLDGIKFILWDDKTYDNLSHREEYYLLTDRFQSEMNGDTAATEKRVVNYSKEYKGLAISFVCYLRDSLVMDPPIAELHNRNDVFAKWMPIDLIAEKLINLQMGKIMLESHRSNPAIHVVSSSSGGAGKSLFAETSSEYLSGKSGVCRLFGPNLDSRVTLESILWRSYMDEAMTGSSDSENNVLLETDFSNDLGACSGFSSLSELWDLDVDWFIKTLKRVADKQKFNHLWLILPCLFFPWTKMLLDKCDYHWHLEDVTDTRSENLMKFWISAEIVTSHTNIVKNQSRYLKGIAIDVDLPFDPSSERVHYNLNLKRTLTNRLLPTSDWDSQQTHARIEGR